MNAENFERMRKANLTSNKLYTQEWKPKMDHSEYLQKIWRLFHLLKQAALFWCRNFNENVLSLNYYILLLLLLLLFVDLMRLSSIIFAHVFHFFNDPPMIFCSRTFIHWSIGVVCFADCGFEGFLLLWTPTNLHL